MPKTTNENKGKKPLAFDAESAKPTPGETAKKNDSPVTIPNNSSKTRENAGPNLGEEKGKGRPFPGRQTGAAVNSERVSLKIVDGKFDAESLRPETAERVREVMKNTVSDSDARAAFGLSADAAPLKILIPEKMVHDVFDMGAKGQAFLLSKKTALPYTEVYSLVKWDKDEHEFLDPRGAELANKYIPESWLKYMAYSDLVVFFGGLAQMIQAKSKIVEDYAKAKLEAIGKAGTSPTPQPQPAAGNSQATASAPVENIVQIADVPPDQKSRSLE